MGGSPSERLYLVLGEDWWVVVLVVHRHDHRARAVQTW